LYVVENEVFGKLIRRERNKKEVAWCIFGRRILHHVDDKVFVFRRESAVLCGFGLPPRMVANCLHDFILSQSGHV
jgi:hypothetical protein